jgi:hypothetical protein
MTLRPLNALLVAAVFGALVAGAARGADLSSSKTSPIRPQSVFRTDRILMLAADGPRTAVVTSKKHGCGQVVVWTAPGRRVSRFGLGNLGCNFDGVGDLALGGLAMSGAAFLVQRMITQQEPAEWLPEPQVDSPLVTVLV